jgi:flavodoxin
MNAFVVYDSQFGNTARIAQAIGDSLGDDEATEVVHIDEMKPEQLSEAALLVVGSPTQRFNPTQGTAEFLKSIPEKGLHGVKVTAFDTRFTEEKIHEIRVLAFFVNIFGYAASKIADRLEKKGGELVILPEGFYVEDTEGPLLEGELERAREWGRKIKKSL